MVQKERFIIDMSISLRIVLICISIVTMLYVGRKLKKSQVNIFDTFFWFFLSVVFVLISVFPIIAEKGAELLGIYSASNFVFLIVIFLLLFRCFLLSIKVSQLEDKLKNLTQELAIRENMKEEQK